MRCGGWRPQADVVNVLRAFQVRKSAPAIDDHAPRGMKTRARAERLHPCRTGEIAELLPGSSKNDDAGLRDAVLRGSRNAHGFMRGESTRQVGGRVEDHDREIGGRQLKGKQQPKGFFDYVRVWFVRKAKNSNRKAPGLMGFYKPGQSRDLGAVETIRGFGKIGEGAATRGQRGKGAIVARKTGAAIADRALQILGTDPRIESQRVGNHADIGFGKFLAQT